MIRLNDIGDGAYGGGGDGDGDGHGNGLIIRMVSIGHVDVVCIDANGAGDGLTNGDGYGDGTLGTSYYPPGDGSGPRGLTL
jgi:hypothetical protein